jgi:hypothetical protein
MPSGLEVQLLSGAPIERDNMKIEGSKQWDKFVRKTASQRCGLCNRRLGIKNRSEHCPTEHYSCHGNDSASRLG